MKKDTIKQIDLLKRVRRGGRKEQVIVPKKIKINSRKNKSWLKEAHHD